MREEVLRSLDEAIDLDPGYEAARLNRAAIAQLREGSGRRSTPLR